jgi:glycosyltransferase involved in cell wall biosynthesis
MIPWQRMPNVVNSAFTAADIRVPDAEEDRAEFRFLSIGALLPWKNHADLLRAFAIAFKDRGDVRLRIGGKGPLRQRLEHLSRELEIQDQVAFLGELSREKVLEEIRECDAFVLPSNFETFSVVLIESLAMGKPVVATDCGGPREIVNDDNGLLVPVGDVDLLAEAMQSMIEQRHLYPPISLRQACIAEYGEQAIIPRHLAVYESVLE